MSGFTKPTTTQTPDALFDYWQTRLSGAEIRVLLYAIRRTFGFGKDNDNISLDQFLYGIVSEDGRRQDDGTGLSKSTLLVAIKKLTAKGLLIKTRPTDDPYAVSNYRIHVVDARRRATAGLRKPNTTPVPDEIFDYWMPRLTDNELKVLLYITRRTLGFSKVSDIISPDQLLYGITSREGVVLDEGSGVSARRLYDALNGLVDRGLLGIERRRHPRRGNMPSRFFLVFDGELPEIIAVSDPRLQPDPTQADTSLVPADASVADTMSDYGREGERFWQRGGTAAAGRGSDFGRERGQLRQEERGGHGRKGGRSWPEGYGPKAAIQQTDDTQKTVIQETDGSNVRKGTTPPQKPTVTTSDDHPDATSAYASSDQRPRRQTAKPLPYGDDHDDGSPHGPGRQRWQLRLDSDYQALVQPLSDIGRELGDEASPRASATRAYNLMRRAGISIAELLPLLSEAKALTRLHQAGITKMRTDAGVLPRKNMMPHFFATLESLLSRDEDPPHRSAGTRRRRRPLRRAALRPGVRPQQTDEQAGRAEPLQATAPGSPPAEHPIWRALLREMQLVITQANYDTWLAKTYVIGQEGDILRVAVPQRFHKDWLENKLHRRITTTLRRLGYDHIRIEYVVDGKVHIADSGVGTT